MPDLYVTHTLQTRLTFGTDPHEGLIPVRLKYTSEDGNFNPERMPAVTPSQWNLAKYAPPIVFDQEMQLLTLAVIQARNWVIDRDRASKVLDRNIAFTNTQGWGWNKEKTEYIYRKNWILNEGLTAEYSKLEDAIICAGSLYYMQDRSDGHLWAIPGKSGIDVNLRPLPTVEQVFERGWFFYATSNTRNPSHFPQGWNGLPDDDPDVYYGPVIMPYFLQVEVPYTKAYFQDWNFSYPPEPLTKYIV